MRPLDTTQCNEGISLAKGQVTRTKAILLEFISVKFSLREHPGFAVLVSPARKTSAHAG